MNAAEKAAAVRAALAKHEPPSAAEVLELRRRLGIPEDIAPADPSAWLIQFTAKVGKDRAA